MSNETRPTTKAAQSEATRTKLLAGARELFGARGYAAVGTEEVVRSAGVTRGALYHQFADKRALFAAVLEDVESELVQQIAEIAAGAADPLAALRAGAEAFLDADPGIQRIAIIDAPSVLGWETWREIGTRHGLGLIVALLEHGMSVGAIRPVPATPMAHLLLAAVDEAALLHARGDATRADVIETMDAVLAALRPH